MDHDRISGVTPDSRDPDPSPLGQNLIEGNYKCRINKPAVRKHYLEHGPGVKGTPRGQDDFVEVSWNDAFDLVAAELKRVVEQYGNTAIYAGSYGWASAGRFHHAQSQLHRFLNCIGGCTRSANAYSFAAAEVILPHVIGQYEGLLKSPSSWPTIAEHCELMVCFGGMPLRNSQITNGGMDRHVQRDYMKNAAEAGVKFVCLSPSKDDTADFLQAEWQPLRPGTDVALMLGLANELYVRDLHDELFLHSHAEGFDEFVPYLTGERDGIPKTPDWAAEITGVPADTIRSLALRMSECRTMISVSWSLSRQQWGEHPYWMGITLAAMLGEIGLPGRGIGIGYAVENKVGKNVTSKYIGHLSQGASPIFSFIPVARITDMLLSPGADFRYNGRTYRYPDAKLIYWAGGNPFHHHQDLNRLVNAWQNPDTVICHELVWNAFARHSDIVLPVSSSLERNDIGGAPNEDVLCAMKQVVEPFGESKTDYAIFSGIAERMDVADLFTEGRDEMSWVRELYDLTRGHSEGMPDFDTFWETGEFIFRPPEPHTQFQSFREDREVNHLTTPSGKIEICSATLLDANEDGHATWHEPEEWLGNASTYPLHLVSHQPASRLHSQLDHGGVSQATKIQAREPIRMNPVDASDRGLDEGDVVRVYNDRGSFLAGLQTSDHVMQGVIHIATGAWWDPNGEGMCKHGNPNAVTLDIGTSPIAQGPSALTCLVEVEMFTESLPGLTVFEPPV